MRHLRLSALIVSGALALSACVTAPSPDEVRAPQPTKTTPIRKSRLRPHLIASRIALPTCWSLPKIPPPGVWAIHFCLVIFGMAAYTIIATEH